MVEGDTYQVINIGNTRGIGRDYLAFGTGCRQRGQAGRRIVDWGNSDGKSLGRGVDAAVTGAAAILQLHGYGGCAVGIGRTGEGQVAVGIDPRLHAEQGVIAVGDDNAQGLGRLIGRARNQIGRPVIDGLRTGIFQHGHVAALGKGRGVVDRSDRNTDGIGVVGYSRGATMAGTDIGGRTGLRRRCDAVGARIAAIHCTDRQGRRRAVVIRHRHEANPGGDRHHQGRAVADGANGVPIGAVGGVLPGTLSGGVGRVADNGQTAQGVAGIDIGKCQAGHGINCCASR